MTEGLHAAWAWLIARVDAGVAGALLGALVCLILLGIALAIRRRYRSFVAKARARRAGRGEARARALLEAHGYTIEATQVSRHVTMRVDGEETNYLLRADFVVRRGARRFVADAKTGRDAPSPTHAPTRRQLLEYAHTYDVDGALLVQPESGRVVEVAFVGARAAGRLWPVAVAFIAGAALGGGVAGEAWETLRDEVVLPGR